MIQIFIELFYTITNLYNFERTSKFFLLEQLNNEEYDFNTRGIILGECLTFFKLQID